MPKPEFDWHGLMRAGLVGLKLTPQTFWHLSPIELRLMLGLEDSLPRLNRTRLAEMISAFPDAVKGQHDDTIG